MAIKVNARETELKIGKNPGYYYVMTPELYLALNQKKVIKEAALRSGVSQGVMQACWDAAGEVIKAWATEGHSVAIPGLGTIRFAVRAQASLSAPVGCDLVRFVVIETLMAVGDPQMVRICFFFRRFDGAGQKLRVRYGGIRRLYVGLRRSVLPDGAFAEDQVADADPFLQRAG